LQSVIKSFIDAIKHLSVVRNLPNYFDEEERRLVFQSVVIGIVVWAVVFTLKSAVHFLFETLIHWLEEAPTVFLVFVPLLIGAIITAVIVNYRATTIHYRDKDGHIHELNDAEGDGLERAIALYYTSEPTMEQALTGQEGVEVRWQMPTFTLAARKFLATLTTLGSGGSGGLEASVTLIGESLSAGMFKPRQLAQSGRLPTGLFNRARGWWRANDPDHLQTAQLSGIAAAVAVLLGAPLAAAFFATEVMYRNRPIIEKLVYSLISALVAYFLTNVASAGHTAIFEVEALILPPFSLRYFGVLVLMAATISVVSLYFGRLRASFEEGFHHRQPDALRRHLMGAAATGLIAVIVALGTEYFDLTEHGLELVLGPGESAVHMALNGELTLTVALIALIAKMLATLATIGSGGSAGLLVPSLFFGTMVAAAFAPIFGYEPIMLIIPAMAASLISIVNVPIAAILFTVELFGANYMVPALVVLVVTSILAHDNTIYRTQRETHSRRQILPGASVRRVAIPAAWVGKTLVELDFRRRFDLTVIGLVEQRGQDGRPHVRLDLAPTIPLELGDILVVLGADDNLDELSSEIRNLSETLEE
jgi:CIC family chloride channel protein